MTVVVVVVALGLDRVVVGVVVNHFGCCGVGDDDVEGGGWPSCDRC